MKVWIVAAWCLVTLSCSAVAHPLDAETTTTLQEPRSWEADGLNRGLRNLLHWTGINQVLLEAATRGRARIVEIVLDGGADPNYISETEKRTPLGSAAGENQVEVVEILLEAEANVDIRSINGSTALNLAAMNGATESAKLLLEAGADPNEENLLGLTPVLQAASNGHVETVRVLVEGGGDIDKAGGEGTTGIRALHIAVAHGHLSVVKELVRLGADVNAGTVKFKETPLQTGAIMNAEDEMQVLIDAGADVDRVDINRLSPLMVAAFYGHWEAMKILLDAGASVGLRDKSGQTAEEMLCRCTTTTDELGLCEVEDCERPARLVQLLSA